MKTHKSHYFFQKIAVDTTGITSNCNTISFINKGNGTLYIKTTANANLLPINALETITFGGRIEGIVSDTFDITFETGFTNNLQIIKETITAY